MRWAHRERLLAGLPAHRQRRYQRIALPSRSPSRAASKLMQRRYCGQRSGRPAPGRAGKQRFNVEQIDGWLIELAKDMRATVDPVQLRVLASVQFQFETTKRG